MSCASCCDCSFCFACSVSLAASLRCVESCFVSPLSSFLLLLLPALAGAVEVGAASALLSCAAASRVEGCGCGFGCGDVERGDARTGDPRGDPLDERSGGSAVCSKRNEDREVKNKLGL